MSEPAHIQQRLYESYALAFAGDAGRAVLEDMRRRAFCTRSLLARGHDGHVDLHIMAAREGARDFVLETEEFIRRGLAKPGEKPRRATSRTAEGAGDG